METTENNRLIAEFMGLDVLYNAFVKHETAENGMVTQMKYHTSWDWLMPVVDKIEKADIANFPQTIKNYVDVCIYTEATEIKIDPQVDIAFNSDNELGWEEDILIYGNNRIDAAYKAVVEFIKWYNENHLHK